MENENIAFDEMYSALMVDGTWDDAINDESFDDSQAPPSQYLPY